MHSEKKKNRFEIDMCNGSIMNKLISFSIPLMLSGILQLAFNAVDIVVVGRFSGSESLAAVGSTTALINVFTNLFIGISLGANVLAARFYAAGREKEMSETVHTAITFAIISGVVMALVGLLFSRGALELMGTPDNVINLSTLYMKIYFLGMPFFMLYNYGAAILRAVGDTKRPLLFLIVAGVIKENEGTIEGPIGRHPVDRKKMAINYKNGKEAVTHYRVLERFPNATYVECRLETGRTHQIRVHMTSIGHPLLGDEVYGSGRNPYHLQGQTLHAMILGFVHPSTGEYMEFTAPLPEYFEKLLEKLRK